MSAVVRSLLGIVVLLSVVPALAQDVVVGELPEVFHWGSEIVNGRAVHAYSVATTSCNEGDAELLWVADTAEHPVIAQNVYRLRFGRLEQLGQSWLKHGFFALQLNICDTCTTPVPDDGTRLGVGCSDPYSARLNGNRFFMGPRSDVNPTTGEFTYPPTQRPPNVGRLSGRIQIRDLDLLPQFNPDALYFIEGMYVASDDAAANNDFNNASYRRVSLDAGLGMQVEGSTMRERPAIHAWRDHGLGPDTPDPTVTVVPVDVPGDGRFWVASRAQEQSNGRWVYDYAVLNLNSDRAASSFKIPLPAAGQPIFAGFRGVAYHSGEIYDNTDWEDKFAASAVTWSSPTSFDRDPASNALRWGTMYSFLMISLDPPTTGAAEIGLFKPGTPESVQATVLVPKGRDPVNDDCEANRKG